MSKCGKPRKLYVHTESHNESKNEVKYENLYA